MAKGYVYILKDKHFKKGVKIGRTQGDVAKRMRPMLTANPWLRVYLKIYTSRWIELERATHNIIKIVAENKRVENSEFYKIEPEKAKKIMLEFARLIDKDDFKISTGDGIELDNETAKPVQKKAVKNEPKGKQPNFSFAAFGIKPGDELKFTQAPLSVTIADEKNKITYKGKSYSLSGFVKAFHPHPSKSGSYQGPKYFTYKGTVLDDLRKGAKCTDDTAQIAPVKKLGVSGWKNVTQLAKYIARRGGNEGAAGGIGHILNARRACHPDSKWRKPLEDIGVKFDAQDFVTDWQCAKRVV